MSVPFEFADMDEVRLTIRTLSDQVEFLRKRAATLQGRDAQKLRLKADRLHVIVARLLGAKAGSG